MIFVMRGITNIGVHHFLAPLGQPKMMCKRFMGRFAHEALRSFKGFDVDDLQFRDYLRTRLAVADHAGVHPIFDNSVDGCVGEIPSIRFTDVHFNKVSAQPLGTVALVDILVKNHLNDFRGILVYHKIADLTIPLVHASLFFKAVSVCDSAAGIKLPVQEALNFNLFAMRSIAKPASVSCSSLVIVRTEVLTLSSDACQ